MLKMLPSPPFLCLGRDWLSPGRGNQKAGEGKQRLSVPPGACLGEEVNRMNHEDQVGTVNKMSSKTNPHKNPQVATDKGGRLIILGASAQASNGLLYLAKFCLCGEQC